MARNVERNLTYLAGAVLLIAALGFGLLRSEGFGVSVAREGAQPGVAGNELTERYTWFAHADSIWEARCAGCHEELTYIPELFAAAGGRQYLVDVMLFGALGETFLYGEMQSLRHRPFADQFDDEDMAALLNLMLVAWGNEQALPEGTQLYTAAEVAAARPRDIPQEEVLDGRPEMGQ